MPMKNKLKQFIETRQISTYRFVRDCGISDTTGYSLINNPDQIPSSKVLVAICEHYKVQPNEILELVEA